METVLPGFLKKLLLFFFLFVPLTVLSQFGVNINLLMPPNPSPYFSDWLDDSQQIQLIINNTSDQTYFVQIHFWLSFDGSVVVSNDYASSSPEEIEPGTSIFNLSHIIQHVDGLDFSGQVEETIVQTGKLPAGVYEVCVNLFDLEYQQWITEPFCHLVTITDYQLPYLVHPYNGQEFYYGEMMQFQFSPVTPPVPPHSAMYPVVYNLVVMEILENQSPMEAFLSNFPVMEQFLENQTQAFWPADFEPPLPGMSYVWSVKTIDAMGNPLGPNEGWAEPHLFAVQDDDTDFPPDLLLALSFIIVSPESIPVENAIIVLNDEVQIPGIHYFDELLPGTYFWEIHAEGFLPQTGVAELIESDLSVEVELLPVSDEAADVDEDCNCEPCHIAGLSVAVNNTVLTVHSQAPLVVGEEYTFTPAIQSACPPDCPQQIETEVHIMIVDINGNLLQEETLSGSPEVSFSPRRSGTMNVTVSGHVICGENICPCNPLSASYPVGPRTIADGIADQDFTRPPVITDPSIPTDGRQPEEEDERPPHTPVIPRDPPVVPPEDPPPGDPIDEPCQPGHRTEPGPPIVLNITLEENGKFPYPRAVPLHAHAIDWDLVFFNCEDCEGRIRELQFPVMDNVSDYTWELLGKGSLNEPFRADQIMDIQDQIDALEQYIEDLEDLLSKLTDEIAALPEDLERRQKQAEDRLTDLKQALEDQEEQMESLVDMIKEAGEEMEGKVSDLTKIREEINALVESIEEYVAESDSLKGLLENHPTEEEITLMQEIEQLFESREILKEEIENQERSIIDQKKVLQDEIRTAREAVQTSSKEYNELRRQIPDIQNEINKVYEQVYTTETITHVVEQKNPWIEGADQLLEFMQIEMQISLDTLENMIQARNEVERWVPGFFFSSSPKQMQTIVDTVMYFVESFNTYAQHYCDILEEGELQDDCNNRVYWMGEITTPFVQSVSQIIQQEIKVFSPEHLQKLDSLQNLLNAFSFQLSQLANDVEQKNRDLQNAMQQFTQSMTAMENEKKSLEESYSQLQKDIASSQDELTELRTQREETFLENQAIWERQLLTSDSLRDVTRLDLKSRETELGVMMADSVQLSIEIEMIEEQIAALEDIMEDTRKIMEQLDKILALDISALLNEKNKQKEKLENQLKDLEEQLKELYREMDQILEGAVKSARGPVVYYIPPPLEDIMQDKEQFEELKEKIVITRMEYQEAVAFKASLQGRFTELLESLSRDLRQAKLADQRLEELKEKENELSDAFNELHDQKEEEYKQTRTELENSIKETEDEIENSDTQEGELTRQMEMNLIETDQKNASLMEKKGELALELEQLRKMNRQVDSLNSIVAGIGLHLRELANESRRLATEIEKESNKREQLNDQLSNAILANDNTLEANLRSRLSTNKTLIENLTGEYSITQQQRQQLENEHTREVGLLETAREQQQDQLQEVVNSQNNVREAQADYEAAMQKQNATYVQWQELMRKRNSMETRLILLQRQLDRMPALAEIISADGQLQDANQAMIVARQERQKMEDLRSRSMNNIESYLTEKDRLQEQSDKKLEEAITARDNAIEDLREFLLEEFENVEFADTLRITARDDVIDEYRSGDDEITKEVIIMYNSTRIPELIAEEDVAAMPPMETTGAGDCEITFDPHPLSAIVPRASQVIGPEPRTIALIYENGKPLWPEWPVMPNNGKLLAGSALLVRAGGSDQDLIIQLCDAQADDCNDPPPVDHVLEDVLDFLWSGDGTFINQQPYSNFVIWEPKEVDKPECNEPQEIKTEYFANTVVTDDKVETSTFPDIEPGILIEVTDSLMGYPEHEREVVARIVKGDYKGLPGEYVVFTVELTEGHSEGWGFGSDSTRITVQTDGLGYARADFQFGDGFAAFQFTATWIREEEAPECDNENFIAEAPIVLQMHYLGFSVSEAIREASKEIWEGTSVEEAIAGLDDLEEDETAPAHLLAVAGLLDHNKDFIVADDNNNNEQEPNPGKVLFSIADIPDQNGTQAGMQPEEALTELFGIADSWVVPQPEEEVQFTVTAEIDEEFYPLGRPPVDNKGFDTQRIYEFRIGREDDLFIVKVDEGFSPYEAVNGTGNLFPTAAPGQMLLETIAGLELSIQDVTLEEVNGQWIALDGKVSWLAATTLSVDMWGFSFGLDSVVFYPVKGAGIGGKLNHSTLSYPVGYYAELFTNGDFWGELFNLPEIEVGEFKLHKGAHLVLDWRQDHSIAGLKEDFRGIVIRQATLDLPPIFRSSGSREPAQLLATDFAIGTDGLHGSVSLSGNPMQIGYAGFDFTLNSVGIKLKNTAIEDFEMAGTFSFPEPIDGSVSASVSMVGDSGWSIELETGKPLNIPKFKTALTLNTGTGITWDKETETGTAILNAEVTSEYFSDVSIVGLEMNNQGVFKAEAIHVNVGVEIAGKFSFHLNTIAFNIGEGDDHIILDGSLGLAMIATGDLEGSLKVISGPSFEFVFKKARLEYERYPFAFEGELAYDGNEFRGEFDITIKNLFGLEGLLIFGNTPLNEEEVYNYWYAQLVMKAVIPVYSVSILELGGGVGYNYLPPIGSFEGSPDFNESLSFKAIIGMGNSGVPPGKAVRGRMEMAYMPGLFTLAGKMWLLEKEKSLFGEGQLNLYWEPEVNVDGKIRTYIGLADAEGKIMRFNGEISYNFGPQGYYVKSEDISGHLFEFLRGEMAFEVNENQVAVDGRIFFDAEGELDILVAILRGHISMDARAAFAFSAVTNSLQANASLQAFASVDIINNFWGVQINVLRGEALVDFSVHASPQQVKVDAIAEVHYDVWFASGRREINFGYEI